MDFLKGSASMTTCPSCGALNRDEARFCSSCGSEIASAQGMGRVPALVGATVVADAGTQEAQLHGPDLDTSEAVPEKPTVATAPAQRPRWTLSKREKRICAVIGPLVVVALASTGWSVISNSALSGGGGGSNLSVGSSASVAGQKAELLSVFNYALRAGGRGTAT